MSTLEGRPRVALITSFDFPHIGGVTSHMQLLARKLGIPEADVISARSPAGRRDGFRGRLATEWERYARFVTRRSPFISNAKDLIPMIAARLAEPSRGDAAPAVAHCHDALATWAAVRARGRSAGPGYRIVSTIHGPMSRHMVELGEPPGSPAVRSIERCEREAWAGADALIAVDRMQGQIAIEQGADPGKVSVIHNAVDLDEVEAVASALPLVRGDGRPTVLVPRRLVPKNGIEFSLRAVALMSPRPRLLIAGGGPGLSMLRRLAETLGLHGRDVLFLGGLEHPILLPLLASVDVVAVPSVPVHGVEEATSIAAIEAMALRKPVVASAIGGLRQLIMDGVNGLLVPPADPKALAVALDRILSAPELAARLAEAGRRTVAEQFSVGPWMDEHRALYARVSSQAADPGTAA